MESKQKGILKKTGSYLEEEQDHMGIKWDEEVIQEHDKERGTRMIIDEPKTPYEVHSDEDNDEKLDQAPDIIEIQKHLSEADENAKLNAQLNAKSLELLNAKLDGGKQLHDEDDEMTEEERKKKEEFKRKMKNHYKGEAKAGLLLKKKYN